ncbi:hypothetical protein WN943_022889 [Citrus x changshan-huyou]
MEFLFTAVIITALLVFASRNLVKKAGNKKRGAPEAGGGWPVIGHLHLLGGPEPLHKVLGKIADKYGPILTIKIGVRRTLVVSNWEIAKECLTTSDKVFATRPKTVAGDILCYDSSLLGFVPYGHYWRQIRKIATLELLSSYRLESLKYVRESEVRTCLKELYNLWDAGLDKAPVLVDMKKWCEYVTLNVILRMVVGKRCNISISQKGTSSDQGWKDELSRFFEFMGKLVVSDALPFLRWLDIGGDERLMKKTARELDLIMQRWLDEHRRKGDSGDYQIKGREENFMGAMLSILDDIGAQEFPGRDADTINKATCLALILGGSDTTSGTLTWAISLLLNNRHALKKAQEELDQQVGKERAVDESDTENLVYLQAIIKETLRLYPAGPLLAPREAMEDCTVSGYHVPAGTRLMINAWKIQRDPRVWENPSAFQPERFLPGHGAHADVDVRGQQFELIPFGSGRRSCPGASSALQVLHLTLARLLHSFELATPLDQPVDMSESPGLTIPKATPLKVLLSPRLLPANPYGF